MGKKYNLDRVTVTDIDVLPDISILDVKPDKEQSLYCFIRVFRPTRDELGKYKRRLQRDTWKHVSYDTAIIALLKKEGLCDW